VSGEAYALICAFFWALSSTMLKSQTNKGHITSLIALRTLPPMLVYWGLLVLTGQIRALSQIPLRTWLFLSASSITGMVIGDLMYLQSMKLIGLSRAMPLSITYIFFTILLAWALLNEALKWTAIGGAALIACGAYLLAFPRAVTPVAESRSTRRANGAGVLLALAAAVCWASSTVLLRVGVEGVPVVIANTIRLSVLVLALLPVSFWVGNTRQVGQYGATSLVILSLSGLIGMGIGSFAFVSAVQLAGAARSSIISAASPLFAVPMSLLLKEKPSPRTWVGTALTVAGVWLTLF
jgi:DME family drug/metabolite transporter